MLWSAGFFPYRHVKIIGSRRRHACRHNSSFKVEWNTRRKTVKTSVSRLYTHSLEAYLNTYSFCCYTDLSFIKPRVKLNSEVGKILFRFWSTHRVSWPSLHGTGRFHLVKGEASNFYHTNVPYVAHAWGDGELINIKCACCLTSTGEWRYETNVIWKYTTK